MLLTIYWYAQANNKYVKDYDKNKKSSYLKYLDLINYMERQYGKSYLQVILSRLETNLNLIKISWKTTMKVVV